MSVHRLSEDHCPKCDKVLDAATMFHGTGSPSDGDLSVCAGCFAVVTWKGGKLVLVPAEVWQSLPEAPELRKAMHAIQLYNSRKTK